MSDPWGQVRYERIEVDGVVNLRPRTLAWAQEHQGQGISPDAQYIKPMIKVYEDHTDGYCPVCEYTTEAMAERNRQKRPILQAIELQKYGVDYDPDIVF